jgi:hypothetical protein
MLAVIYSKFSRKKHVLHGLYRGAKPNKICFSPPSHWLSHRLYIYRLWFFPGGKLWLDCSAENPAYERNLGSTGWTPFLKIWCEYEIYIKNKCDPAILQHFKLSAALANLERLSLFRHSTSLRRSAVKSGDPILQKISFYLNIKVLVSHFLPR